MQEMHLYEYAVIRAFPKVEREEFINVGVIIFCKREKFIKMLRHIDEQKWQIHQSELDVADLHNTLDAFEKICYGEKNCGILATLAVDERFRWLTAVRSTCLQTTRPHTGFCKNLDNTLQQLFKELVL